MDELLSPTEIERLAAEAGLTINDLCKRAEIAHTTFYRWKAGRHTPGLKVYRKVCAALRAAQAAA